MASAISRRDLVRGGLLSAGALQLGQSALAAGAVSRLDAGGHVTLFDVAARLAPDAMTWLAPLHAWGYRPQTSRARKAAIAELFARRYGLAATPATAAVFDRRINLLLADNLPDQRVVVTIAGTVHALPPTAANGHARREVAIPVSDAAPASGGQIKMAVLLPETDSRPFAATVHLLAPTGISIISDIDDTVKLTGVTEPRTLWESTFFKPFAAVPGMRELLGRVGGKGAPVHYVSSSPWHFYDPLKEWLDRDGLPATTLDLKQIRLKDRTVFDIAKSPAETKPPQIESLLARYPGRSFVLVGDSGERDPEIYAATFARHPQRVTRMLIRRAATGGDAQRLQRAFAAVPRDRWQAFDDPGEVAAG